MHLMISNWLKLKENPLQISGFLRIDLSNLVLCPVNSSSCGLLTASPFTPTQGVFWVLPRLPLPLQPANSFKAIFWGNYRAHIFFFLASYVSLFFIAWCPRVLKSVTSHILSSFMFISGRRIDLIPVMPSQSEAEVLGRWGGGSSTTLIFLLKLFLITGPNNYHKMVTISVSIIMTFNPGFNAIHAFPFHFQYKIFSQKSPSKLSLISISLVLMRSPAILIFKGVWESRKQCSHDWLLSRNDFSPYILPPHKNRRRKGKGMWDIGWILTGPVTEATTPILCRKQDQRCLCPGALCPVQGPRAVTVNCFLTSL